MKTIFRCDFDASICNACENAVEVTCLRGLANSISAAWMPFLMSQG